MEHPGPDVVREVLRRERAARGWSRAKVEELTDGVVKVDTLQRVELGRQHPRTRTLLALAAVYGLDADALLARLGR